MIVKASSAARPDRVVVRTLRGRNIHVYLSECDSFDPAPFKGTAGERFTRGVFGPPTSRVMVAVEEDADGRRATLLLGDGPPREVAPPSWMEVRPGARVLLPGSTYIAYRLMDDERILGVFAERSFLTLVRVFHHPPTGLWFAEVVRSPLDRPATFLELDDGEVGVWLESNEYDRPIPASSVPTPPASAAPEGRVEGTKPATKKSGKRRDRGSPKTKKRGGS